MATQEDRSLGSGMSIPKWMKSKINDKFDFDQSAFSPTELDDSFMYYYRHPPGGVRSAVGTGQETTIIASGLSDSKITVAQVNSKKPPDFSKHPPQCQKYLQGVNNDTQHHPESLQQKVLKSQGTDDGFKGEAAKCGSSIIRVASQMVSGGKVVPGYSLQKNEDACDDASQSGKYDLRRRRGSRSLPASPLASPNTSPKTGRKAMNKYFTGAFTDVDKHKGGWILSNLLARREISQSVGYINEETKDDLERSASTASIDELSVKTKNLTVFKAKPSELREMNFWSPTSM